VIKTNWSKSRDKWLKNKLTWRNDRVYVKIVLYSSVTPLSEGKMVKNEPLSHFGQGKIIYANHLPWYIAVIVVFLKSCDKWLKNKLTWRKCNTCSFRSLWVTLPLNLFFPTHFVLFPSALIWAVDGTVCPAEYALYHVCWKCADPELDLQIRCFPYGEHSDVPRLQ
jgi:hypothetical protein